MSKWKYEEIETSQIQASEINANKMTDEDFNKLMQNIQKSGGLSSAITCYKKPDGTFVIISGHHRFAACVKLSYVKVPVVFAEEKDLSKDEILALQISHNSLHGSDDKGILKRMFEEIQSVDFKFFANIDISEIQGLAVDSFSFSPELVHYTLTLVLYQDAFDNVKEVFDIVDENVSKSDLVIVANGENCEEDFLMALRDARKNYKVRSSGIAFAKIIELAAKGLKEMKQIEG